MSDQYYTVQSAQDRGPAQFGAHRWSVIFEETNDEVSMFSKYPIKAGDKLYGRIESVTKGDKTYTNFKFAKKEQKDMSPAANSNIAGVAEIKNYLDLRIMPKLNKMEKELIIISEKLGLVEDLDESDGFPKPRFDTDTAPF